MGASIYALLECATLPCFTSTGPYRQVSMSEEPQLTPQAQNPPEEKARLECEKLKAEIKAIGKPLFKTPGFYSAFAPVMLAILGLVFTWSTGWFDVQRTRVSNEKTLLEAQTERLRTERTTLEFQAREQERRVAQAQGEINALKIRESQLTNQLAKLVRERDDLQEVKVFLESETKRLAGSDTQAVHYLEQTKSLQELRETLLGNLQTLQASNALLQVKSERQTALIGWANDVLSLGWHLALADKVTWAKFRRFGDEVMSVHFATMNYLPEWQSLAELRALDSERGRTYDDDLRTETARLLAQARIKTYEDYIRQAEERFHFLQYGIRYNNGSDSNSSLPSVPPRNPRSL